jgi:hypothetical protein
MFWDVLNATLAERSFDKPFLIDGFGLSQRGKRRVSLPAAFSSLPAESTSKPTMRAITVEV